MITNNILLLMKSNFFFSSMYTHKQHQKSDQPFQRDKKEGKEKGKKIFLSLSLYAPVLW